MLNNLLYFSFLSLLLGQFGALFKSQGANFYLFDLCVGIFVAYGLLYFFAIRKSFIVSKFIALLLAFCGAATLSFVFAVFFTSSRYTEVDIGVAAFYLIRLFIYILSACVIENMVRVNLVSMYSLFDMFIKGGVALVIAGFFQLILVPDFETLDSRLGWDPHKYRLASTFFDPNFVGAYLVICLILALYRLYISMAPKRVAFFVGALLLFIGLVLTFSRSAWLMFAVAVFIFGVLKTRRLLIVAVVISFLAYFAVPRIQTRLAGTTDPADSAQFRVVSWKNTYKLFEKYPVLGVGYNFMRSSQYDFGTLTPDSLDSHAAAGSDSSLLFVLATTGIIGGFVFLVSLFYPVICTKFSVLPVSLLFSLMLESQFINSFFYPQIMFLWMSIFAVSCYSFRILRE